MRACARRIFTERVPDLVAAYGRHTHRLATALRAIGLALGGNAGARLAARLRLPTSPSTLLRLVRGAPTPPIQPCRPSASTSGPGGGAIGTAPSWSIWRRIASSTCCRTARPRHSRPGWPSSRRSPSSAVIAVTSMRTAFVEGPLRRCRSWTASISSATSARPSKPSWSPNAPCCRRRPCAWPRPSPPRHAPVPVTPMYSGKRQCSHTRQQQQEAAQQRRHAPWVTML